MTVVGDAGASLSIAASAAGAALVSTRVCDRPCGPCPFKRSNAGKFANLAHYAAGTIPGRADFGQAEPDDPCSPFGILFACHHADTNTLCAGHVAVVGREHPAVRLAVSMGLIDPAALIPGTDWPAMFSSYEEMIGAGRPANSADQDR
ncbi:hypothetical protein Asp14428_33000 [Actinoplanes sp. NBRC 14428]|nr:hypothetical protein Asp14428_33000 [Actinoplanes sp. NBRC 14428]